MSSIHLLSLPTEVIGAEIFSWLDNSSLTQLDRAVISTVWRDVFLQSYFYLPQQQIENLSLHITTLKMRWLVVRNIAVTSISLAKRLSCNNIANIVLATQNSKSSLTSIQFNGNTLVSDKHLQLLAHTTSGLSVLYLWNCHLISDYGIISLIRSNPNLTTLDLWRTGNNIQRQDITNKTLFAITQYCPHIQHLNLAGCIHLTDTGILALANGSLRVKSLNISGCHMITNASLLMLTKRCLMLSRLNIQRCYKVELEGELEEALRKVHVVS